MRYATSAWLKTDRRRHNLRIVSGKIERPRLASCADASRTMIVLLMQHKPLKPMMFGADRVRNVRADKECRLRTTDTCPIEDVGRDAYRSCLETF